MIAIIDAYRAGLLKTTYWWPNILAGIIVGIVALPLAMAFAIASGVKPEQGLYTAIIAGLFVGIFGGTRAQIAGPTGAFVVILASITAKYGIDGLQIATLLSGIILIGMGMIKLGSVIKFIPDPVIIGFTSGIGVIIFVGEWKDFFGLAVHLPLDAPFHQKLFTVINALPHLDLPTTALGLLSVIITLITPKINKRIPGPLIAMLIATILQAIFQFDHVATLGSAFGGIPHQLPAWHFPVLSTNQLLSLIGPAFTIALLGAIESLLSATAADSMGGTRHHANQELIGQGLANIVAPLFTGFAATGAIARTATNIRNGGNSPIAAITHSIFLILTILLFAPFATYIPLCSLAAILFIVAYNMSDVPRFMATIHHASRDDISVLFATFLLTIFVNLVVAVNIGVIVAMLFSIRRITQSIKVEKLSDTALQPIISTDEMALLPQNTLICAIQGPFFFAAAEKIQQALTVTCAHAEIIIFRLKDIPFMDITGLKTFQQMIAEYHQRGVKIYLCEANHVLIDKFTKNSIMSLIEENKIFNTLREVVKAIPL